MTFSRFVGSRLARLGQLDALGVPLNRRLLIGGALLSGFYAKTAKAGPPSSSVHWFVRRLTLGETEAELATANSLGYEGYLEHQLNYTAIDDSAIDARIASYSTLNMEPNVLRTFQPQNLIPNELIEATILRSVFSQRQLYQRMVEFWTDHFNIDLNTGFTRFLKTVDDREVIRPFALDTFPNLLMASAKSPAMLVYLDNISSVAGNPNENYARELMELHTLGVNGGYTQNDVVEVARCLTGWTLYPSNAGANALKYRFDPAVHDTGSKTVLGQVIPAGGGESDGLTVLNLLAYHPNTAAFISWKICKWFHSETPPQSLVDAVTATYTSTGGDIKSMLRTLFLTADPMSSPQKYKRPYHHYVSAMRATNATISSTSGLRTQLTAAGHLPFNWGPPDGYPDTLDQWVGLILPRWNFGASMATGAVSGVTVDITAFLAGASTATAIVNRIDAALFNNTMPAAQKNRVSAFLSAGSLTTSRMRDAVGLAIGTPAFQWY